MPDTLHLPPAFLELHRELEPMRFPNLAAAMTYASKNPEQYTLITPRGNRIPLDTTIEGVAK